MKFVATKAADQLDLQALHRVRERLVRQRTGIINQLRALERGIAVRQGLRFLRTELPGILAKRSDVLSPRMTRIIEDLAGDWRRLDERIEGLSADITSLVEKDPACERLMTVPGIGPIISSAMVDARRTAPATPGIVKLLLPPRQSRGAPVVTRFAPLTRLGSSLASRAGAMMLSLGPLAGQILRFPKPHCFAMLSEDR
jgi:transposase